MTDRELLELAAKAMQNSGNPNFANFKTMEDGKSVCLDIGHRRGAITSYWRPMYDDGDALRLALKITRDFEPYRSQGFGWIIGKTNEEVRRAIVRAAAEIGKAMK